VRRKKSNEVEKLLTTPNMIVKALITYTDGSEALFTGKSATPEVPAVPAQPAEALDLSTIPLLSPAEQGLEGGSTASPDAVI
jgi:hypothetical protein